MPKICNFIEFLFLLFQALVLMHYGSTKIRLMNYLYLKRCFDFMMALCLMMVLAVPMLIVFGAVSVRFKANGLFLQQRIGQHGQPFTILKIRTIDPLHKKPDRLGLFLRETKLDELPQLVNILVGNMSFVGPRPDIEGYYDRLVGEDRKILELKPGITSEAAIKYRREYLLLSAKEDPLHYNDNVIFPDKVKLNLNYYYRQSFAEDIRILIKTFIN